MVRCRAVFLHSVLLEKSKTSKNDMKSFTYCSTSLVHHHIGNLIRNDFENYCMAVDLNASRANLKVSVDEVISVKVVVILTEGIEQSFGDLIVSSSVNLLQY